MTGLAPAALLVAGVTLAQTPEVVDPGLWAEGAILIEAVANLDGGVRSDAAGLYLLRGSLVLDGRAFGAAGFRAHVTALAAGGSHPGAFVGDLQGTSNIAAADAVWPYEAWIQQNVGGSFSALVGVYDVNSEFDSLEVPGLFLHSSFGIGADFGLSGPNGPSIFPATGLAVRLAAAPRRDLRVRLVAADGTPGDPSDPGRTYLAWRQDDGVFLAGQLVQHLGGPGDDIGQGPGGGRRFLGRGHRREQPGKVGLGVWRYEGAVSRPQGKAHWGAYLLAEGQVPGFRPGSTGLGVCGRIGLAAGGPLRGYLGAGATASGPVPSRPDDEAGLGIAVAWPDPAHSDWSGRPRAPRPESVIELSYRVNMSPGLFIQPDLQYVTNPVYAPDAGHALVMIIRLGIIL